MRHILHVVFYELGKQYIARVVLLVEKGTFIFFGFPLCLKVSFTGVLIFTGPVCVVESAIPQGFTIF